MRVVVEIPGGTQGIDFDKVAVAIERAVDEIVDGHPGRFTDVITDWPTFTFKPSKKRNRKSGDPR